MCRLSGRHDLSILFALDALVNSPKTSPARRLVPNSSTSGREHVDVLHGDSCARLSRYCSLLLVKYDISCGGQLSKALVKRECWAASAAWLDGGFRQGQKPAYF